MKSTEIDDGNYGMSRCHLRWGIELHLCFAMIILLLVGCTPTLYSVNMRYVPSSRDRKVETVAHPYSITVATFEDVRKINDNIQIGRVIKSNGLSIPVLPKFVKPPEAVTRPFKEFFQQAGYKVLAESPLWNLKETGIRKEWGDILVGGSIDELDVICIESLASKKYKANVKLTVLFADTKSGKIFHRVTTESSATLEHVIFSEEHLEKQINIALSGAIEKILGDTKIADIIREAAGRQP
jgi:hypothetical protein